MIFKKDKGFECAHCHQWVDCRKYIGTHFRNHCPHCFWSKHVDLEKSGDRQSLCHGQMEPVGLTFKHEGWDKYGQPRRGELMLIHHCTGCGKTSINRIAADDKPEAILNIFQASKELDEETKKKLEKEGIKLLCEKDRKEIKTQLFGKK